MENGPGGFYERPVFIEFIPVTDPWGARLGRIGLALNRSSDNVARTRQQLDGQRGRPARLRGRNRSLAAVMSSGLTAGFMEQFPYGTPPPAVEDVLGLRRKGKMRVTKDMTTAHGHWDRMMKFYFIPLGLIIQLRPLIFKHRVLAGSPR